MATIDDIEGAKQHVDGDTTSYVRLEIRRRQNHPANRVRQRGKMCDCDQMKVQTSHNRAEEAVSSIVR